MPTFPARCALHVWCAASLMLLACAPAAGERGAKGATGATGCAAHVELRLYLGLASPNGLISDGAFDAFLRAEVVRRFPAGFTVLAATGSYRGRDGKVISEPSRILEVWVPAEPADRASEAAHALRDIGASYKQMFQQESVLRSEAGGAVCFE